MPFPKKRVEPKPKSKPPISEPAAAPSAPSAPVNATVPVVRSVDAPTPPSRDLPEELIAARAYELWQNRGCPMGQDSMSDWLAARAELEQERLRWAAPEPDDRNRI